MLLSLLGSNEGENVRSLGSLGTWLGTEEDKGAMDGLLLGDNDGTYDNSAAMLPCANVEVRIENISSSFYVLGSCAHARSQQV